MSTPDIINGCLECAAAGMTSLNVRRVWKDRMVRGVDWRVTAFHISWGLYNLYFYPSLGQWCSLAGGIVLTLTNAAYVASLLYFRRK